MNDQQQGVRLNKYLSEIGHCSRRAADKLIDAGRIQVNGQKVVMGQKVSPSDRIEIDGVLVENLQERNVYLAFNKPVGIVCTTDTRVEKDNIIDYINYPSRIFPFYSCYFFSSSFNFMRFKWLASSFFKSQIK